MGVFSVVFHHGGHFVQDSHIYYRGGSDTIVEGQDEDKWSFFEAVSLVRDWGYEGFRLWRKIPQLDEGFTNVVDDAACVEIAKHCMACKVDGHIWVEHGVKDMMTKVVHPNVDDFSTSSETESSGSDSDAGECFDDSEEERVIEVEDEQFNQVEVDLPESGNRVNVHGKFLRFKRCASKDPKNMKAKSMVKKVNLLVPKSVLVSSSKRNTTNDEDVENASETSAATSVPLAESEPAAMTEPGPASATVKKDPTKKKKKVLPVKPTRKRVSERLKEVKNAKRHGGPGSTPDAPLTIDEPGGSGWSASKKISKQKWKGIARRMTQ